MIVTGRKRGSLLSLSGCIVKNADCPLLNGSNLVGQAQIDFCLSCSEPVCLEDIASRPLDSGDIMAGRGSRAGQPAAGEV